ncbi:MAG TPA: phosphatidylglycerol lysyltransferase domain-containing protein [Luteolibacter sp.]
MIARWLIFLLALIFPLLAPAQETGGDEEDELPAPRATVQLSHMEAGVRLYEPDSLPPKAILIFGSGDGGWSPWEDAIARWLREENCYVVGFDFREYATKDYDLETLSKDMAALARDAASRCQGENTPVIYTGWSMGAVQAVAAASKNRPPNLAGVILLSADSRGRYGLRASDELGVTPEGAGTFSLSQFNPALKDLRIAQFHGGADFMASTAWIQSLTSPHALYTVPGANHGFDGPDDSFKDWIVRGVNWVLGDDSAAAPPPHLELPWGLSPLWPAAALAILLAGFFLFSRKHSIRVLVAAVVVMGAADLLEAMFAKPPSVLDWMENWVPLGIVENSRMLLLVSGLTLLALARGLSRHKRMAWVLSLAMLAASVVLHLTRAFDWHHALAAAVLLVPLIRWRKEFIARSDASSIRVALGLAGLLATALFVFGALGLRQHSERGHFGVALTWKDCAAGSAEALIWQKSEYDHDGSRVVRAFLRTLRLGSLLGSFTVLALMLRPVMRRRLAQATPDERQRVSELIDEHGRDPMDSFALLSDKSYLFSAGDRSVVAYTLWRNFAVALADPIGPEDDKAEAVRQFVRFCKRQDWTPVFYCSHVAHRALYEQAGLVTFKVGEDARLSLENFNLQGGKFQNLRTAGNRARKENMEFVWYDAKPTPDHGIEAQLKLISDQWLSAKHGGEMSFDLGSFRLEDLRERGVGIVRNAEGRIEAFATWLPFHRGHGRALDLMRGSVEARNGGLMDFLILECIARFRDQGVTEISLGNAPLANVRAEGDDEPTRPERATQFLFENFDRFYGYKSLFRFKRKYHPDWQGRYLAYPPGTPLPMLGLAITGVHLPEGFRALLKS